ncbi:2712_t:CDS:2, partial [Dentiscutata erythropus]
MPSILSSSNNYEDSEENDLPTGVFILLTDCYSPTCTRDNLYYSIACPRRLEQAKQHLKVDFPNRVKANRCLHARKHRMPNQDFNRSTSHSSMSDRRK